MAKIFRDRTLEDVDPADADKIYRAQTAAILRMADAHDLAIENIEEFADAALSIDVL